MKKILFLDLENTIIDTWDSRNLSSNIRSIKEWISSFCFDKVYVFSYAICDIKDREDFIVNLKPWLESALNIEFNSFVLTIDDIKKITENRLKCKMDRDDFFTFIKKDIGFIYTCSSLFKGTGYSIYLLDDMVSSVDIVNHSDKIGLHLINVKEII